jgi:hypothetical protein
MRAKVVVGLLLAVAVALPSTPASAALPGVRAAAKKYVNCTALQHDFPHGVARPGGADRVKGRTKPVTTFTVNAAVYNANKRLDGDNDGVACEKR